MTNPNQLPKEISDNLENPYLHLDIPETIDRLSDLRLIEDEIFLSMYPGTQTSDERYAIWSCRPNVEDVIRPRTFNGEYRDIQVQRMADPLNRLLSSKGRGLTFIGRPPTHARLKNDAFLKSRHEGLVVTANAHSKNSGIDTPVQYELWYAPLPDTRMSGITANNYGNMVRYVARETGLETAFEYYPRKSDIGRIGISGALGSSMPISRGRNSKS